MSFVQNRVWDTELTGSVIWRTSIPDTTGIEYPGPGTFGVHTSDYTVIRDTRGPTAITKGVANNDEQPDGFWTLDGNILDHSGNGRNLSLLGGTINYANGPFPGTQAFYFNGSTRLSYSADSAFYSTGSISLEAFIRPYKVVADRVWYLTWGDGGETLATNVLYSLYVENDSRIAIIHERGAGIDEQIFSDYHTTADEWSHIALTRDGATGLNSYYLNGRRIFSGSLPNPEDGSSGFLTLGAFPNGLQFYTGLMSNVRIYNNTVLSEQTISRHALQLFPEWSIL